MFGRAGQSMFDRGPVRRLQDDVDREESLDCNRLQRLVIEAHSVAAVPESEFSVLFLCSGF